MDHECSSSREQLCFMERSFHNSPVAPLGGVNHRCCYFWAGWRSVGKYIRYSRIDPASRMFSHRRRSLLLFLPAVFMKDFGGKG